MYAQGLTIAAIFRPKTSSLARFYDIILIFGGSLLIALSAQISFRLPFSPVPITGQTFAILMAGALLGANRGALCVLAYLFEGAIGLPVFAGGGAGIIWLFGPTGGYLVGFVAAAWAVGKLCERGWDRNIISTVCCMIIGNICLYSCGVLWLSYLAWAGNSGLNLSQILTAGVYPFVVGEVIKMILAAVMLPCGWKLLSKNNTTAG